MMQQVDMQAVGQPAQMGQVGSQALGKPMQEPSVSDSSVQAGEI